MKQIRLKNLCLLNPLPNKKNKEKNGTFLPMEKVGSGSFSLELSLPYEQMCSGYTSMQNNDVIRAIVTPCFENNKGTLLKDLENGFAFGSTEFMCLRPKKINSKFLYYITASEDFKIYALKSMKGVGGLRRINSKFALTYTINNYPLSQQTTIANYLDHHTTKLDKEISLLEQKVEKLDEYKQALIYETVTKGLDKNVPMKDSGIEWIGMIPEHWEVKRVKDFSQCYAGGTPETNKDEYWESGTNYWAASGNLKNGLINLDILKKITDLATKNSSTKKINPFTTLIAMTGATCGEVGYSDTTIYANQSVCAIKNKKRNSNYKYIFYYFLSARKDVESLKLGGAQAGINGDDVKHIKIVFPNILEQQQIIEYLDEQCSKIDKKKELINKKVELLKEYKQSLIYEAVTGKIEVGEYNE